MMPDLMTPDETDRALLAEIADGLPLDPRPYDIVGRRLGLSEENVISRLKGLIERGVISRFGVIVHHRELGYTANAMVAWDIPDDRVQALGGCMAAHPFVTLCYQRRRHPPEWPYNVYCMIHGKDREAVMDQIATLSRDEELEGFEHAVLFSKRRFKQRGARYGIKENRLKGAA
jgi:DNA-binding Lrp family transcriptional regulator